MADVIHRPFRHLCPQADLRDAMDEDEFWDHVFHGGEVDLEPDYEDMEPIDEEVHIPTPCEVCGSTGACGYDTEGRALIHAVPVDDES
jgi:hypothetical protein